MEAWYSELILVRKNIGVRKKTIKADLRLCKVQQSKSKTSLKHLDVSIKTAN
jgi:hypothetical protein